MLAIVANPVVEFASREGESVPEGAELVDVVLDATPFYAGGGGG